MGKKHEDANVSRRNFLKKGAAIGLGATGLAGLAGEQAEASPADSDRQRGSLKCNSRQLALDEPSVSPPPPPPLSASRKKHRSPNVPNVERRNSSPPLEVSSSQSGSISSSGSIQSATAPMLSNAASFELQTSGELGQESPDREASNRALVSSFMPTSSASASHSPSLGVVGKMRQKFVQVVPQESQSQPNSPMLSGCKKRLADCKSRPTRGKTLVADGEPVEDANRVEHQSVDQFDRPAESRSVSKRETGKHLSNCDTDEDEMDKQHFYEEITSQTQR